MFFISLRGVSKFRTLWERSYATRHATTVPEIPYPFRRSSYFNWKVVIGAFAAGASLAYTETIFEQYALFTVPETSNMLPVRIQHQIKSNALYQQVVNSKRGHWQRMPSWTDSSDSRLVKQDLISQFLGKPGGIVVSPVLFFERDLKKTVSLAHLGYRMCGYPLLVHGGVLAALLNELYKRSAALLSSISGHESKDFKVQSLNVTYRHPTFADQVLAIETTIPESSHTSHCGVPIESKIISEKGKVLVVSEAVVSLI